MVNHHSDLVCSVTFFETFVLFLFGVLGKSFSREASKHIRMGDADVIGIVLHYQPLGIPFQIFDYSNVPFLGGSQLPGLIGHTIREEIIQGNAPMCAITMQETGSNCCWGDY